MTNDALIKLWVNRSLQILTYNDAYPDIEMGMFQSTAVDQAQHSIWIESKRWSYKEDLNFDEVKLAVLKEVASRRMRRRS